MKHIHKLILIVFIFVSFDINAQVVNTGMLDTLQGEKVGKITIGAYVDTYFKYDFNQPLGETSPYFVSYTRHNEFNINLAFVEFRYQDQNLRIHYLPAIGTYINANYAAEDGFLKNALEATVGIRIAKKKNIWLDAGVMNSPFTNETPISKDHLALTRSFSAEYVPYYLSGIRVSTQISKKLNAYIYIINGWQQIKDQNKGKSVATQLEYRPNNKHLINWNIYIGSETSKENPNYGNRYFTDVYWIYNPNDKWNFTACAYAGIQERVKNKNGFWTQANLVGRYKISQKTSASARLEYFTDPNEIIEKPVNSIRHFELFSGSFGFNFQLQPKALFRIETRYFHSPYEIFYDNKGQNGNRSVWLTSGLTAWF